MLLGAGYRPGCLCSPCIRHLLTPLLCFLFARAAHSQMVRAREADAAQRAAERKQVADRMYEKVRHEMEAALRGREEEDQLINLLRQVRDRVWVWGQ